MAKIIVRITISVFSVILLLSAAIPKNARSQNIPPELRDKINKIEVIEIDGNNEDIIWALRDNPDRAEILDLKIYAGGLSTGQIKVIDNWLQSGRGIIVYGADSDDEYPKTKSNRVLDHIVPGKPELNMMSTGETLDVFYANPSKRPSQLLNNVEKVKASYSYGGSGYKLPYTIERSENTKFTSLLETKEGSTVFASWSLENGGRVVYFGVDANYPPDDYKDLMDNHQFIANTMIWLTKNN